MEHTLYWLIIGAIDKEQDFFEKKMWLKVRPHWYLYHICHDF